VYINRSLSRVAAGLTTLIIGYYVSAIQRIPGTDRAVNDRSSERPIMMRCRLASGFLAIAVVVLTGCRADSASGPICESIHAFYYGWYASEKVDGQERHWNHEVLGVDGAEPHPGTDDIGANFYPELGAYSSNDARVLGRHLEQAAAAGIGVLVASWWGPETFEDANLPLLMDAAAETGLGVAFHLEPFPGRDAATSRDAIRYLLDRYGDHPALYRSTAHGGRPVFYVYDSYVTPAADWSRLLRPEGDLSVRGTPYDVVAIGLWVTEDEGEFFLTGGFDGVYTYFASDGFTWGSTADNWPRLADWARDNALVFVPCVGPGYLDTRVRPWNGATTRSREDGVYYDRMFRRAIDVAPPIIGITSFNEWHEGTQIEPAVPKAIAGYRYEDYEVLGPGYYLDRTRYWVDRFAGDVTRVRVE